MSQSQRQSAAAIGEVAEESTWGRTLIDSLLCKTIALGNPHNPNGAHWHSFASVVTTPGNSFSAWSTSSWNKTLIPLVFLRT